MDFENLKFNKCLEFDPKNHKYTLPDEEGLYFLFSYSPWQIFFSQCKSCLLHSFRAKDGTNKKSIYATLREKGYEIELLYKKFRKLEKELNLQPCSIKISEFRGVRLLHFNDPKKYSNFVALELLAIMIKHCVGISYTQYDYNGILTKMWKNMTQSISEINKLTEGDLSKFLSSGTGALTWSKCGLFNEITKQFDSGGE